MDNNQVLRELLNHLSCEVNLLHQQRLIRKVEKMFEELQDENDKLKEKNNIIR
ncbi:hypothetical protein H9649_07390 [Sporosarcina sp. Sa2YVA2]|uniref:Uncharacterized protein n=1 Tax=Sporosarcina quadrami TaxID=2762234 RepID=A0ABR8U8N7_9BACL|nr:hypothetical protein [Sporosarcina quadrami]MBD7984397.1 hypothetical protein [Sporosarcina quadrami]